MSSPVTRKLAAILAADAVGYSRLMGENEEGTVRVLSAHRAVIDGIIDFHHGRIVGTAGDSVLAEFASAVDALRCAVEIQQALDTRNASLPESTRMRFRIGINLGDVVVKGDDLLGDGVNVAARLEGIAEPGGICISSSVYDQIAGKLDLGFVEMGERSLKNIGRPVRVYRVAPGKKGTQSLRSRNRPRVLAGIAGITALAAVAWFAMPFVFRDAPAPWAQAKPVRAAAIVPVAAARPPSDDSARRILEERLDVEHREGEARMASEKARAVLEIAKAHAEAELSRARADAEAVRREAVTELAAAREVKAAKPTADATPPRVVSNSASLATKPPPVPSGSVPAAPKSQPAVLALAAPASSIGSSLPPAAPVAWSGTMRCEPFMGSERVIDDVRVRRDGDAFVLERRPDGKPGHFTARGKPSSDGKLQLTGEVIAPRGRMAGQELPVLLEGAFDAGRYLTHGHFGKRPCAVEIVQVR
jgi:class 3 adenylate cyclase